MIVSYILGQIEFHYNMSVVYSLQQLAYYCVIPKSQQEPIFQEWHSNKQAVASYRQQTWKS